MNQDKNYINNDNSSSENESIDFDKLLSVIKKNAIWLLLIIIVANLSSYLFIRWTKPLYESSAELKLEIESDASEFGIGGFFEEKNLSIIAGEMEILKSKLLLKKVIDSLDIKVSYFTLGNILVDEKYPASPIDVVYTLKNNSWYNKRIYLKFKNESEFTYAFEKNEQDKGLVYKIGEIISTEDIDFTIKSLNDKNLVLKEDLYFIINSEDFLIKYLEDNLIVQNLNLNANTIKISFQDHNQAKAKDIIRTIYTIYLKYTAEQKSLTNKKKINWLNSQLSKISSELEGYETYFEDFTITNRTSNLEADLKLTIDRLNQIDSQRFELDNARKGLVIVRESFEDNERIIIPRKVNRDIANSAKDYNNLIDEREKLGLSYKETTFVMQKIENQIQQASEELKLQINEYLKGIEDKIIELNKSQKRLENNFTKIPGQTTEFNKNQRFYNLYEEFYLSLMQSKAEFEIAVAGLTPNFKILSPASDPIVPVYPKKIIVYGIGLISGVILCFFFVGIIYLLDNKINNYDELERIINYPFLGSVPKSKLKTDSRLITHKFSKSGVTESIRNIRTNIQFLLPGTKKTISISSVIGGEGKTFISLNLASILASTRKRVILLDLDMRKPKVHTEFNNNNEKGVSTILIGKSSLSDSIFKSEIDNLDYIPSGPIPPNPSELLINGEFVELLEELEKTYDYIIIDTPPAGLVTDALIIMRKVALNILVIRANYTSKKLIKNFKRQIGNIDVNPSIILNSISGSGRHGYYYGYYNESK